MKKVLLVLGAIVTLSLSSCATILTKGSQAVTFNGMEGTRIYSNGMKIATIGRDGSVTARIKKQLSDKELIAKKEGYRTTPLVLTTKLQPVSFFNLLSILGWGIDFATGKVKKYDTTFVEVEMEKK